MKPIRYPIQSNIEKGDAVVILGYNSVILADTFRESASSRVDQRGFVSTYPLNTNRKCWGVAPADCFLKDPKKVMPRIEAWGGVPKYVRRAMFQRGRVWVVELVVKKPNG